MKRRNKILFFTTILSIATTFSLCFVPVALIINYNQGKNTQTQTPSQPETVLKESELPTLKKSQFSVEEFRFGNLSFDQIKQKINSNFFYENRTALFDNANNVNPNSVSNISVNQTLPYELTIKFELNNNEQEIKIIKTIEEVYGDIEQEIKQEQTPDIESFNNASMVITNDSVDRNVNTQYYDTELVQQYGSSFKYPAYNYDYEKNENSILKLPNGTKIDMSDAVMDERATLLEDGKKYKYSDPTFIHKEIEKNRLKKHPAADGIHEQKLSEKEKAVEKFFSLPSYVKGMTSLGLYAPAGEVCELKFTDETYELMKKYNIHDFKIVINQSYWDNYRKPDKGQISKRYPYLCTEFTVSLYDLTYDHKYKFGTPFGGTISVFINSPIQSPTFSNIYKSYSNYNFTISGATQMLSYYHGLTSESDWNEQINKVKNGLLTSPEMAIDFPFGSTNIPFTGYSSGTNKQIQIAYTNIDEIIYPKIQVDKWNSFLILSEYFASRDIKNDVRKLNFRFNDDVWGGGAAWGGGNVLSCPVSWAKSAFLTQAKWSISNNWGTLHEINHNFQQNGSFFIGNSHGEANQVTMANFSIISDTGRWRNLANPSGEYSLSVWQRMANMFSLIQWIKNNNYNEGGQKETNSGKPFQSKGEYEYQIYGLILFMIGSYNYVEYARNDIATDNGKDANGNEAEGGFYEILELSDYFKLDFWPALQKYYPIWFDDGQHGSNNDPVWDDYHKWPKDYDSATPEQKKEIDRLNSSYKSFDFIGNIYASGIYMYDNDTGNYVYTNDTTTEYSIPVGKPYTFDFEKGINWLENDPNYQFSWSQLKFESKTKLGGTLELDPTNNKKLIYTPPANSIGEIDEFDMAIVPDEDFLGRPSNYVPLYKWKIKVKQVPNAALASSYIFPDNSYLGLYNLDKRVDYMRDERNAINTEVNDLSQGIIYENKVDVDVPGGTRIKLNFIAPKTGTYKFKVMYNFSIKIFKGFDSNAKEIYSNYWYSPSEYKTIEHEFKLNKGDILPLDIYVLSGSSCIYGDYIYKNQRPYLNIKAIFDGQENVVDFASNIIDPNAVGLINDPSEFITNKKYQYSSNRTIDLNRLQTSLFGINVSRDVKTIDTSNYTFEPISAISETGPITPFKNIDGYLKKYDKSYLEIWAPRSNSDPDTNLELTFNANFNQPTRIGSVNFYNRIDNWTEARPTKITIKDQDDNILYSGKFGSQFADRSSSSTIINFDKIYEVEKLKFIISNDTVISNGTKRTALIIDAITFNDQVALHTNKVFSIQDPQILPYGNWKFISNESGENISYVNGRSIKSTTEDDFIVFDIFAQGFDIVGQKAPNNSNFDIYINDEFVANVKTNNIDKIENTILYSYTSNNQNGEQMRVKIINKSNNPLYLDYIQTYGKKVYLSNK